MTDFGLSKVGLINSTDDLSGFSDHSDSLLVVDEPKYTDTKKAQKQEGCQKQNAVGTPDYLAPEILLGMGHGLLSW